MIIQENQHKVELLSQLIYCEKSYIVHNGKSWSARTINEANYSKLSEAQLHQHFSTNFRYGIPFLIGSTCKAAVVDVDNHSKVGEPLPFTWEEILERTDKILKAAKEIGLIGHPFKSRNKNGVNIWFLWEEPQVAKDVIDTLTKIAKSFGYKVGNSKDVEIFPKQSKEEEGKNTGGNGCCLPRYALDENLEPTEDWKDWEFSSYVEPVEGEEQVFELPVRTEKSSLFPSSNLSKQSYEPLEEETIISMLKTITPIGLSYKEWFDMICAIKAAGGDYEVALQWSQLDPAYKEDALPLSKWESIQQDKEGGITAGTLVKAAQNNGWKPTKSIVAKNQSASAVSYDLEINAVKGSKYKGRIISDLRQLTKGLTFDSSFPYNIWFDTFFQDILIQNKSLEEPARCIEDNDYVIIRRWFEDNGWEPVGKELMRDSISTVAFERKTNIATDWANSLVWDGVDRYDEAVRRLGVEFSAYTQAVIRYQWTAQAARILVAGHKCDSILVLISEQQGLGKTTFVEKISPQLGNESTYREVSVASLLEEATCARSLKATLCANLDEMHSFNRSEAAQIKTALSRTHESWVEKYQVARSKFGRQCLIYGTTNKFDFLNDETGNRRYYPLNILKNIDLAWYEENRDQLWAQGVADFKANGLHWEEPARLGSDKQKDHLEIDIWSSTIAEFLLTDKRDFLTSSAILDELSIDMSRRTKAEANRVAKILRSLGWTSDVKKINGVPQKGWKRPLEATTATIVKGNDINKLLSSLKSKSYVKEDF